MDLQNELSDIEEKVAFARQFYNTNVLSYNNGAQLTADQYTLFVRGDQIHDTDGDNLALSQPKQLAVANGGALNVSLVTLPGDGSLQAITNYAASGATPKPSAVLLADLNRDRLAELIVANSGTNTVDVFQGLAADRFANSPTQTLVLPAGANPQALVVGDFNRDGAVDIGVANAGTDNVTIFLNTGTGLFGAGLSYSAGKTPGGLVTADFDGDGRLDLAVVDGGQDFAGRYDVIILLGDTVNPGRFISTAAFDTGLVRPTGIAAGDFRGRPEEARRIPAHRPQGHRPHRRTFES
jgi:hypothetical protein